MQIEHQMAVLPVDEKLVENVDKFKEEGWMVMPGVMPIAIYHLIRVKMEDNPLAALGAKAIMTIDETKVHIIRDGKVVE